MGKKKLKKKLAKAKKAAQEASHELTKLAALEGHDQMRKSIENAKAGELSVWTSPLGGDSISVWKEL